MKYELKKLKMRLPAMILLAVTLLFWGVYDRYEVAGPVMLESPSLTDAFRVRGDSSETNSVFTLNLPMSGKHARPDVRFELPGATQYKFIRVRGRIRTENVVRGKYSWNSARLMLIQRDENKKWVPGSHSLLAQEGSNGWEKQEDEFELMPEAAHVEIVLQQTGTSGLAQFDSVEAFPVRMKKSYPWFRSFFALAWVGAGVLYFRRCRLHERRLKVLILLNAVVIIAGTLMPGTWVEEAPHHLKKELVEVFRKPPPKQEVQPLEKAVPKPAQESKLIDQFNAIVGGTHQAGHFALFASLCFLVYLSAALERQHPAYFLKVAFDVLL
ncbi:MAG: hypothetical protein OES84_05010, partial [Kiritimatiellaceae bacterium]|nr:hypothetical protein [Kiritimatiellaceae bacterium]